MKKLLLMVTVLTLVSPSQETFAAVPAINSLAESTAMKAGDWEELKTQNIDPTLKVSGTCGASQYIFGYTEDII